MTYDKVFIKNLNKYVLVKIEILYYLIYIIIYIYICITKLCDERHPISF